MGLLVLESKRDDLLIPYLNKMKEIMPELTLGAFKGVMLDKLAAQGGLNNLSLGSNFYLAGATKYYFQGALTTDGKAHLLSGNPKEPDNWNDEVCKRLNALINVLRNSYIDSIGTKFEQPEDFGELPLAKLLKKYGKKIDNELGIKSNEEEKNKSAELDRNPRVGNGYTFDILPNYESARKYNRATSPGAWCITYGQGHFDNYVRRLGIHYVIFLKDGYENVPRQTGPGYTRSKPHDEYGNSMIAVLQSNSSWKPIYITSRWNHGYGDTSGTEADHAYTTEEFCEITGVTPEDLERIYEIWKKDYRSKREQTIDRTVLKKEFVDVTRELKYAQMRINTTGNAGQILSELGAKFQTNAFGNGEINKTIGIWTIEKPEWKYFFVLDRGKIVFDTLTPWTTGDFPIETFDRVMHIENGGYCPLLFISKGNNKCMIYNGRFHEMVSINGDIVFKKTPMNARGLKTDCLYFEVKNGFKDIALISTTDGRPLRLPNGNYWFNSIRVPSANHWRPHNEIFCDAIGRTKEPIAEILYDESSGEKYFFNLKTKKFLTFNLTNDELSTYDSLGDPKRYSLVLNEAFSDVEGYFSLRFSMKNSSRWEGYMTSPMLFKDNGEQVFIYGQKKFYSLKGSDGRFIIFNREKDYGEGRYIYDIKTKKVIAIGNEPINPYYDTSISDDGTITFMRDTNDDDDYAYDNDRGLVIKNSYGVPNEYKFDLRSANEKLVCYDGFTVWEYYKELCRSGHCGSDRDAYTMAKQEEKRHEVALNTDKAEHFENNLPVNNESSEISQFNLKSINQAQAIRESKTKKK